MSKTETSELPGTNKESLHSAALQAAEVLCQMVKGGCPFQTALNILKGRSPILTGKIEELTVASAREKLALQGIKVYEQKEETKKALKEEFDPENVEQGDLVGFGSDKYYVLDENYSPSYFWVSTNKNDRFKPKAKGFSIYKRFADGILERGEDVLMEETIAKKSGNKRA